MIIPGNSFSYKAFHRNGDINDLDMNVDGSVTPVFFVSLLEYAETDFILLSVTFGYEGGKIEEPGHFSGLGDPLLNGIEIGVIDSGYYSPILPLIKTNRDVNIFIPASNIINYETKGHDLVRAEFSAEFEIAYSAKLIQGFYFKIQDDLTEMEWMQSSLRGFYKN